MYDGKDDNNMLICMKVKSGTTSKRKTNYFYFVMYEEG